MERETDKNLILFGSGKLTAEEELELRRKGQKASVAARRKNKAIKDVYKNILSLNAPSTYASNFNATTKTIADNLQRDCSALGEEVTVYDAIALAIVNEASEGDVKCATFVRDSVGDAPIKEISQEVSICDSDKKMMDKLAKRLQIEEDQPII